MFLILKAQNRKKIINYENYLIKLIFFRQKCQKTIYNFIFYFEEVLRFFPSLYYKGEELIKREDR